MHKYANIEPFRKYTGAVLTEYHSSVKSLGYLKYNLILNSAYLVRIEVRKSPTTIDTLEVNIIAE